MLLSSSIGAAALPEEKFKEVKATCHSDHFVKEPFLTNSPSALQYRKAIDEMEKVYSTAKICSFKDPGNCGLSLEPGNYFVYIHV